MPENMLEEVGTIEPQSLQVRGFETLQELVRHGYRPDSQPSAGGNGILLRHAIAPDVVLYPDGRLALPLNQQVKIAVPVRQESQRRISWRRGLTFLFFLLAYTFISAVVIINLTAD
jgi:hypothetical protein